jgi:hypothetical protein
VQRRAALDDAPDRAGGRRAEGHGAGGVDLADVPRGVDLATEHHDGAEARGLGCGRHGDGVEEVRGAVRAGRRSRTDGAGQHDGRVGVEHQVAEHRRLLERVRAVGDHDARALARRRGGLARHLQGRVERQVRAGQRPQLARAQPRHFGQPGHRRDERVGVQRRHRARPRHGDRAAGGEDQHVTGRAHPASLPERGSPRRWVDARSVRYSQSNLRLPEPPRGLT